MSHKIERKILLNPGPATTTDSVKMAQVIPDICPREEDFVRVMSEVRQGLLRIVKADEDYTCVLFAGSGTAVMDAVINSVVPKNKKILVINNGAYGERMVQIAKIYNIDYIDLRFSWNEFPDLNQINKVLTSEKEISHVAIVHHETTTGMLNPLKEVGKLAHTFGHRLIADTISSFAGIPIDIKQDHIDFLLSTSNKCIQGMAGISFCICKKNEIENTIHNSHRSYYLNLSRQYEHFKKNGEMQFTPPVQVVYALKKAIDEYFEEGEANRYKRYTKSWQVLRKGLLDLGFKLIYPPEFESHLLLTVYEPSHPDYQFDKMHDLLYQRGFTIYPGKIGIKKTFRLANIGAIDHKDIHRFLAELSKVLEILGIWKNLYIE